MRLGVVLPIAGADLAQSVELACAAETLGFEDVWSSEVDGHDGFTPLAALASRTSSVRLGVAVAPAATRPVALLAMTAASLQELSDGRFVLGLGSSSPTVVEQWMGAPAGTLNRPLTLVSETVAAVRLALSGESVSYVGTTTRMEDFRLRSGPADVPIMLGALGPRMFRLAGEVADGVLVAFVAADQLPMLVEDARAGASGAGRLSERFEVVCRVPVAIGEDSRAVRGVLRRFIAAYASLPRYNALLVRQGFADEASRIAEAWSSGHRADAIASVSDELLDGLVALGPESACFERLDSYAAGGATTLLISPVTGAVDRAARAKAVLGMLQTIARWHRA